MPSLLAFFKKCAFKKMLNYTCDLYIFLINSTDLESHSQQFGLVTYFWIVFEQRHVFYKDMQETGQKVA